MYTRSVGKLGFRRPQNSYLKIATQADQEAPPTPPPFYPSAATMANPLSALLRRDGNRTRRAGTGRQTTKRTFAITLPTVSVAFTRAAPPIATTRGGKRDAQGLDDVEHFWRDSLESAAADGAIHPPLGDAAAAEHEEAPQPSANGAPTPFRRANKLMRTPAGPATPEVCSWPGSSRVPPVTAHPPPTMALLTSTQRRAPERRASCLIRLCSPPLGCSAGMRTQADEEAVEGPAPVPISWEEGPEASGGDASAAAADHSTADDAADDPDEAMLPDDFVVPAPAEPPSDESAPEPEERCSMGTSPIVPAQPTRLSTDRPAVDRRSMGTSPTMPSALIDSAEAESGAATAEMGCSPLGTEGARPVLVDASTRTSFDALGGGSSAAAVQDDVGGGGAADFDDDDDHAFGDDYGDDYGADEAPGSGPGAQLHARTGAEEDPPPPPPPPAAAPRPKKPRGTRKTSLEKLGAPPGGAPSQTAVLDNAEGGRSRRQRFRPLEYWRGERVIYGRRDSAKFEAVVDVVVAEREPTPPHFRRKRERQAQQGSMLAPNGETAIDPLADAVDGLADDAEVPPPQPKATAPGRVKKKAKKATA